MHWQAESLPHDLRLRNEIDETQELYYPAIMRAIADKGFKGYVAQEFIPTRDPVRSLREAVKLCDV